MRAVRLANPKSITISAWTTTDDYRQRYGCLEYEYSDDVGDSMDDTADLEEDSATARRLQWPVTREAERDASPEFGTAAGAKALFGLPSWSAQESAGFSLEPVAVPRSGRSASVPVTCLLHSVSFTDPLLIPPPTHTRPFRSLICSATCNERRVSAVVLTSRAHAGRGRQLFRGF